MAICYPENLGDHIITNSEKEVYYALKNQLPDTVSVFHSISWTTTDRGRKVNSEADFLIFDPKYGYLIVEVKGGNGIEIRDNKWYLKDYADVERVLDKSPYDQAERSMYYFKDFYLSQYAYPFHGVFGYVVIYPFFVVDQPEILSNRSSACTIDRNGMNDLRSRIKAAFVFHGKGKNSRLSNDQVERFINVVKKRIALSAAAGALIDDRAMQMERINRVQNNLIWFSQSYRQMFVKGGAGTGKTWIAIKLAKRDVEMGREVLVVCAHDVLRDFIECNVMDERVEVMTFQSLLNNISGENSDPLDESFIKKALEKKDGALLDRYNTVIVDEAQDFTRDWALIVRKTMRRPDSGLYVFYDDTQNVHGRDFGDGFGIQNPPFLLRENLRNTANIYKYATMNTKLGKDEILNTIEGPEPEVFEARDEGQVRSKLSDILDELTRESVKTESIVILTDKSAERILYDSYIGQWELVKEPPTEQSQVRISRVEDFKGLEADVIIYLHKRKGSEVLNYVGYTRARFYLFDITIDLDWSEES